MSNTVSETALISPKMFALVPRFFICSRRLLHLWNCGVLLLRQPIGLLACATSTVRAFDFALTFPI